MRGDLNKQHADSGITVGELASLPQLRMRIMAGGAGLDRRVSWAHVSESEAPWDWLEPSDLVMTSGWILPRSPAEQAAFIERMESAGLSGLVVGENTDPPCPPLSDQMLEIADRLGFPLLYASYSASFVLLARTVAGANAGAESHSLTDIMRVHNELRLSLLERRSSTGLINRLGRLLGCVLAVVDPALPEPVLPGGTEPDSGWHLALNAALAERGDKAPTVMRMEVSGRLVLAISVPVERPIFLLAGIDADPAPRLAVLQHVAAACALELTRVEAGFERERRDGAAWLAEALQGRVAPRIFEPNLIERGLDPPWVCIAIEAEQHTIDRLTRAWAVKGVPHVLGGIAPTYLGVVKADDALIHALADLANSEGHRVGVSELFTGGSELSDAATQARWALKNVRGSAGLARYSLADDVLVPQTLSEARLTAQRILEPVLLYDRAHSTELIRTLQTYLECDRSTSQSSKRLFVHNQTVRYRLSRIEELTGRSLRSTNDIAELWFGLRALALSEITPAVDRDLVSS